MSYTLHVWEFNLARRCVDCAAAIRVISAKTNEGLQQIEACTSVTSLHEENCPTAVGITGVSPAGHPAVVSTGVFQTARRLVYSAASSRIHKVLVQAATLLLRLVLTRGQPKATHFVTRLVSFLGPSIALFSSVLSGVSTQRL